MSFPTASMAYPFQELLSFKPFPPEAFEPSVITELFNVCLALHNPAYIGYDSDTYLFKLGRAEEIVIRDVVRQFPYLAEAYHQTVMTQELGKKGN